MKKLNKLSINPEKVIKNDELTNLRGGYDTGCFWGTYWECYCYYYPHQQADVCALNISTAYDIIDGICSGNMIPGGTCQ